MTHVASSSSCYRGGELHELELFPDGLMTRTELGAVGPPARAVRRGPILAPNNNGRATVTRQTSARPSNATAKVART
jgi:hypothetical protein